MSANPSPSGRLVERIAKLDEQVSRVRAAIIKLHERGLPTADLEQSLILLLETRRTYQERLKQQQASDRESPA